MVIGYTLFWYGDIATLALNIEKNVYKNKKFLINYQEDIIQIGKN